MKDHEPNKRVFPLKAIRINIYHRRHQVTIIPKLKKAGGLPQIWTQKFMGIERLKSRSLQPHNSCPAQPASVQSKCQGLLNI